MNIIEAYLKADKKRIECKLEKNKVINYFTKAGIK